MAFENGNERCPWESSSHVHNGSWIKIGIMVKSLDMDDALCALYNPDMKV